MKVFDKDYWRRKFFEHLDKADPKVSRAWEEAKLSFDSLSSVLNLYAEESGGTFRISADERFVPDRSPKLPFPISYFMPATDFDFEQPETFAVFEELFPKAELTWRLKDHEIKFELSKIWMLASYTKLPGNIPHPKMPPLWGKCSVNLKRVVAVTLISKRGWPPAGPTGGNWGEYPGQKALLRLYPESIRAMFERIEAKSPTTTFYCPFEDSGLQGRFALRSTVVSVGNRFAADSSLNSLLQEIEGLSTFSIALPGAEFSDDITVSFMADPPHSMRQIALLHQLMIRALELLELCDLLEDTTES